MRIIFFGTSTFALPILEVLEESVHELLSVVTRPPKGAGRGRKLREPPVAEYSMRHKLDLLQPEKLSGNFIERIREMRPDVMISAAYGAWLPERLLESAPLGVVNIHPSLLPLYRGAAPVARAILDGVNETGVSFMLTDKGWDTGPVIASYKEKILPDDTAGTLEERLSRIAAAHILNVLESYSTGEIVPEQQTGEAVYAEKISSQEAWLDWSRSAEYLERKIRAFQPSPGARTAYSGRMFKIARAISTSVEVPSGKVLRIDDSLFIGCGEGALEILSIQPESKKIMDTADFLRGTGMKTGDELGRN